MNIEETILKNCRRVAIVGLSSNPERSSHRVARYLKENRYEIVPVNPAEREILGEVRYPDLSSVLGPIDVVGVFRRSADCPSVVDEAIKVGAKAVWMQEGVVSEQAADAARAAGMLVVMDKCIMKEHKRLSS